MYNILYRLWSALHTEKLGKMSYIPMPIFLRNWLARYPVRTRVVMYARTLIGTKVYRNVPQDVACANCVTGILELVDPSFFGPVTTEDRINGTYTLSQTLAIHPRFKKLSGPLPGCIIVSPTGKGRVGTVGHTGIVDLDGKTIMSNSSATGTWVRNFTLETWHKRYTVGFGIPPEYFIIIK